MPRHDICVCNESAHLKYILKRLYIVGMVEKFLRTLRKFFYDLEGKDLINTNGSYQLHPYFRFYGYDAIG